MRDSPPLGVDFSAVVEMIYNSSQGIFKCSTGRKTCANNHIACKIAVKTAHLKAFFLHTFENTLDKSLS